MKRISVLNSCWAPAVKAKREAEKMRLMWPIPLAVSIALLVFVGTFFAYADRHANELPGSYIPAVLGGFIFVVAMCVINYLASSDDDVVVCLAKAVIYAVIEGVIFFFLLMFLMLNFIGS